MENKKLEKTKTHPKTMFRLIFHMGGTKKYEKSLGSAGNLETPPEII